jgi:preprotein translocase subunit YajC
MSALAGYPPDGYTARLLNPTSLSTLASLPTVFAQAATSGPNILPLLLGMVAIMYFLIWRPQQKQQKEQQTMLAALKKGDDVLTSSGILGKIFAVDDKFVTLEIASNVKVRMLKSSIQGRVPEKTEKNEKSEGSEAKKVEK